MAEVLAQTVTTSDAKTGIIGKPEQSSFERHRLRFGERNRLGALVTLLVLL